MEQTNSVPPASSLYRLLNFICSHSVLVIQLGCTLYGVEDWIVSVGEAGEAVDSKVLQICVIISCQG